MAAKLCSSALACHLRADEGLLQRCLQSGRLLGCGGDRAALLAVVREKLSVPAGTPRRPKRKAVPPPPRSRTDLAEDFKELNASLFARQLDPETVEADAEELRAAWSGWRKLERRQRRRRLLGRCCPTCGRVVLPGSQAAKRVRRSLDRELDAAAEEPGPSAPARGPAAAEPDEESSDTAERELRREVDQLYRAVEAMRTPAAAETLPWTEEPADSSGGETLQMANAPEHDGLEENAPAGAAAADNEASAPEGASSGAPAGASGGNPDEGGAPAGARGRRFKNYHAEIKDIKSTMPEVPFSLRSDAARAMYHYKKGPASYVQATAVLNACRAKLLLDPLQEAPEDFEAEVRGLREPGGKQGCSKCRYKLGGCNDPACSNYAERMALKERRLQRMHAISDEIARERKASRR